MTKKLHPAWTALVVTFITLMATAGFRSAPSILIVPLEDAFGWSRSDISLAIAINVMLYGLIAPFAAALMERFSVRKVVMTALTFVAISSGSTIFMTQPWHLWALWGICVGVGTGSMALVFAATIANRWFIARKGIVVGALTAAGATGQLIFLPVLSHLAITFGWKSVSLTVAGACVVVVPLIFFFLKESPETIGMTPFGAPEDWQALPKGQMSAARITVDTAQKAFKDRNFLILFFTFFVCGLSTNGLIGTHFIPAAHDHGMGETVAAGLLAMVGVFDVVGTIFSGYLTDKYDPRKLLFFYYGLRGLSLFLLPSILFSTIHPSTLVFVIFYGLDWVATVPPTLMLSRIVLGPARATVVYGWVFVGHQIGASVAAFGAAVLRVHFGDYASAFYISAAMCIVSALAVLQIGKGKTASELRV
ncbi:MAG: MFS transporter [Candidatus Planktophila sp.]